ncbi:CPXCG motif-containing cysteine-rich protein [Parendozoicomonas haliclonae]|uniref:Cysteine-rich CPXCG n=1 Tax=Parendozoicomonas haliclonae TaxID=1960125 RepID=A0A1X7AEK4_9GAMM|nr:CPXCG motif-containing cysteine-rich protein [Parendozoicomonas haliclonae]SMA32634.1 hypothetical protein EHSB41UT_00171 [Parendozoicomonas haliclonae]
MDHELKTQVIACPNCGENIQILVNAEDEGDTYIEDCQVCCSPINITVTLDDDENIHVLVRSEDEMAGDM